MKNRNSTVDSLVIGFALFAMFFGAGNLIFPSYIGYMAADQWPKSMLGFFCTITFSLFGLLAFNRCGSIDEFGRRVGVRFTRIYTSLILIVVASLLALPRTAATTYELAVRPFFPSANDTIFYIFYFILIIFITVRKSKVLDYIGRILTPVLLALLAYLVIKGLVAHKPVYEPSTLENPFSYGFITGYQTMDALASTVQANLALSVIISYGYTRRREKERVLFRAGIISVLALMLVYGGLLILGATYSGRIPDGLDQTGVLTYLVTTILGTEGSVILALIVSAACITTSSGLVAMTADFFSQWMSRLKYNHLVVFISILAVFIAKLGVVSIVAIAAPVLALLYPLQIQLIMLNFFNYRGIFSPLVFQCTVYTGLVVNFLDVLYNSLNIEVLKPFYDMIPQSYLGLIWFIPSSLAFLISLLIQIIFNWLLKKHYIEM